MSAQIAFPTQHYSEYEGMTLRDYFAAKAMQSLVGLDNTTDENIATMAYSMADTMLKARELKD